MSCFCILHSSGISPLAFAPESVKTAVRALLEITDQTSEEITGGMEEEEKAEWIKQLEDQMLTAASALDFEKAAKLRDQLFAIRGDAPVDKHQPSRRRRERMRKVLTHNVTKSSICIHYNI